MSFEQEKQTHSRWHMRTTLLKNIKDLFKRHAYFSVNIWYTATLFFILKNSSMKRWKEERTLQDFAVKCYDFVSSLLLHQLICAGKKQAVPTCTHESDQKRLILSHCLGIVVSFTSLNHTLRTESGLNLPDEQDFQGKELEFKMICPSADSTGKRWHLESMKLHSPICAKE